MPKMKTNSSAKKRFSKKSDTTIKFSQGFRRHLLTKKTTKRKRDLRQGKYVGASDIKRVLKLLPY
jgi:large subunit ribosomal protein L35